MKRQLGFLFLSLFLALPAFADQSEDGHLVGEKLDLMWSNHGLAGHVGGLVLRAQSLEQEFGIRLKHRSAGQEFDTVLKKTGVVESRDRSGRAIRFSVALTGMDPAKGLITGELNGKPFAVQVSATKMNGHHYVSPSFLIRTSTKEYRFRMEGGQACMGCVAKISLVVASMLTITGAL